MPRAQHGVPISATVINVRIETPDSPARRTTPSDVPLPQPVSAHRKPEPQSTVHLLTPLPLPPGIPNPGGVTGTPGIGAIAPDYYAPSALTASPQPLVEPEIQLPPRWLEADGHAILTLYVSADGVVDRIDIGTNDLAPELQDAMRNAFQRVTFQPGEIDGHPVPSILKIEAGVSISLEAGL